MARPSKFVERDALEAARMEFWHRGYERASLPQLCKAMGVNSQSLYGAFGSMHELFMRTLEDYCTSQLEGLRMGRDQATSFWQWMLDVATFEDEHRIALTMDGCFLSGAAGSLSRLDSDVRSLAARTYALMVECFSGAAEAAQRAGDLRPDADPSRVANAVLIAMQGLEFMRRVSSDADFDAARDIAREGLALAYGAREGVVVTTTDSRDRARIR